MQRLNIVKAVVSGDHEAVLRWRRESPEKILVGYQIVDPSKVDLAFLRRERAAGRLDAIAEVEPQYEGIRPDDPRLEPIFALAEELDIPVGLHMHPSYPGAAYRSAPKMRASNGDPLLLEDVLVRHPRLRLYVMHAGWPYLDHTIALMYAHPQVYVDIGVITWTTPGSEFRRFLKGLADAGFSKRIMFGSDQMVWPARIEQAVSAVENADFLKAEQKDDIFYNNAVAFFRLATTKP
jgi:predicted TIM-barrel fold metal-dependent hydrolase